jgi:LCP family protein required for cell wall assembly
MSPQFKDLVRTFSKAILFTFLFLFIFLVISGVGVGIYAYSKLHTFVTEAHESLPTIMETFQSGWKATPQQTDGHVNFLILGTDELANRGNNSTLTDTIMLASLDLTTGKVSLYSLPRDLWHVGYQTRINALYEYGKEKYPNEPQRFTTEVVSELTGVTIHHTIVISLSHLGQLVEKVGGIDVNIPQTFTDPLFPREDVDVTIEHDPNKLYKSITFTAGNEHMDGTRVLEYVRSRHAEGDQGTDDARANRQQQVILALVSKLKEKNFYYDVARLGQLYSFYQQSFSKYLPLKEAISVGHAVLPQIKNLSFTESSPSIFPQEQTGVITHPPVKKYQNQWVYEVRDPAAFQAEVHQKLGLPNSQK